MAVTQNFIFKRHFPIHEIRALLRNETVPPGRRQAGLHLRDARHQTAARQAAQVLEKLDHGHPAMRIYCKNLVGRMYEKFSTFLRVEVCVNRIEDLGLDKGLENLEGLRRKLVSITDRFAGFEAQSLNVHVDFALFQRMALPVMAGKTKIAGIKIHDTRRIRLMEVPLHLRPIRHLLLDTRPSPGFATTCAR